MRGGGRGAAEDGELARAEVEDAGAGRVRRGDRRGACSAGAHGDESQRSEFDQVLRDQCSWD